MKHIPHISHTHTFIYIYIYTYMCFYGHRNVYVWIDGMYEHKHTYVCICICTCMTCITAKPISFYLCPMHERMSPNVASCAAKHAKTCHHTDVWPTFWGSTGVFREFCKNPSRPFSARTRERANCRLKSVWKHANNVFAQCGFCNRLSWHLNKADWLQAGIPWYPTSSTSILRLAFLLTKQARNLIL